MFNGVLHQFRQHHRQRRGHQGVQQPEATDPSWHHGLSGGGDLRGHLYDPVGDVVEIHHLIRGVRQHLVHDGDGADTPHGLVQRRSCLVVVQSPGLKTQQRRHRLEIVLHPVVDLPDRGVLGHEFALAAPQLRDVPDHHQSTDPCPVDGQRDRTELHGDTARLDLGLLRCPPTRGVGQIFVPGLPRSGQFQRDAIQPGPDQVGREAQATVGRQRVRARVDHLPVPVQSQQSVTHSRGTDHDRPLIAEGKTPFSDHLCQIACALQVGQFETTRGTRRTQIGAALDDADQAATSTDRDGLLPDRDTARPIGVTVTADPSLPPGTVDECPSALHSEQ